LIKKYKDWKGNVVEVMKYDGQIDNSFCPESVAGQLNKDSYIVKEDTEYKAVDQFYIDAYLTEIVDGQQQEEEDEDPYLLLQKKELLIKAKFLEDYGNKVSHKEIQLCERVNALKTTTAYVTLETEIDLMLEEIYDGAKEQLGMISMQGPRISVYEKRSIRKAYPIKMTVVSVLNGMTTNLPQDLVTAIKGLLDSNQATVRLYPINQKNAEIADRLSDRYRMVSKDPCVGEDLIDRLVGMIPMATESAYSQNAYTAAQQVFDTLYPEFKELVESQLDYVAKQYTYEDNVNTIIANMGFGDFFRNKAEAWKELNITPSVAKVKMLTNRPLSDKEAEAIVRTINNVRTKSANIYGNKYSQDVTQRTYLDNAEQKQQTVSPKVAEQKQKQKPKANYMKVILAAIAIVCGLMFNVPALVWIAAIVIVIAWRIIK
jgi:hypothetical protein